VTKSNPENCKNCSSKCAYDCAQLQYTIQHRTVPIISPLTSRQTSELRCCLSEERGLSERGKEREKRDGGQRRKGRMEKEEEGRTNLQLQLP